MKNISKFSPVCQTYCTQTYVLAAKNNQWTGIKNKHTRSDVIAMHTNSTENANPLYLKESCTDLNNNQNGQRYSNRNSSKKSAVMTIAHNIRNLKYRRVLLE